MPRRSHTWTATQRARGVCSVQSRLESADAPCISRRSLDSDQAPSEFLGLNQKHVRSRASVVPRVPDAAVTVLLELVVAYLKKPFA